MDQEPRLMNGVWLIDENGQWWHYENVHCTDPSDIQEELRQRDVAYLESLYALEDTRCEP
jgi:hypothetical protein